MATENNAVPGSHCAVKQLEGWFKTRSFKQAGKKSCLCYLAVFINENDLLIAQSYGQEPNRLQTRLNFGGYLELVGSKKYKFWTEPPGKCS